LTRTIKASIVGASGYSGVEVLQILAKHRGVKVEKVFANSSTGKRVEEVFPRLASRISATYEPYSTDAACTSDIVFIALPSGEAMNIVPDLLAKGKRVIDLGGDFRLRNAAEYERFYKREHKAPNLLSESVYGLPEWNRDKIKSASLVANPGCYPTSIILPLAPLLKEGLLEPTGISVSSMSGVSGAGRSSSLELSFAEVNETVRAYKVGVHQHTPEIIGALNSISSKTINITFVPHLLPVTRGIITTAFAHLAQPLDEHTVQKTYEKYYTGEPFIRFSSTPEIKNVNYTNFIDIGFRLSPDNNQLIMLSAIDNLIKGAAGQAVQNMNLMFGFKETEGLL